MTGNKSSPNPLSSDDFWNERRLVPVICAGLVALTLLAFWQTVGFGFVNYDDGKYVYANAVVARGLTLKGAGWAFTYGEIGHWHPLTWLSHMADCQIYGLWAGGHHLTNTALHALTVVLLFLALRTLTSSPWRSAFVAAVFAIHPLRAESVAWIAERKDVLSGVFFMWALLAYAKYARHRSQGRQWVVAGLFAAGLLCKNTLVTLPFVLLLLDWWPLARKDTPWPSLVKEKIPLFLLSAGSCVVTFLVPEKVPTSERLPFLDRMGHALVAYGIYLRQTIYPANLANPYPNPPNGVPFLQVGAAIGLLTAISMVALAWRKNRPYLLVGWLWFLGMLIPAIGLVQISYYFHADRYTYLPSIGLLIAITWLAADLGAAWKTPAAISAGMAFAIIGILLLCAWKQVACWKNSEALWTHTLACTTDNYIAHNNLGLALFQKGDVDGAISQYQASLKIKSNSVEVLNDLGNALLQKGELEEAITNYQKALQIEPNDGSSHNNYGLALLREEKVDEAALEFERAVNLNPENAQAHLNLASVVSRQGKLAEAIGHYEKALQLEPTDPKIANNFAWLLATCAQPSLRNGARALELAQNANRSTGGENPVVLRTLAAALAETGHYPEAMAEAQHALRQAEAQGNAGLANRLAAEIALYQSSRPYRAPGQIR